MAVKRVGVIGSGQLGRMMALAGSPLNVEFVFFDEALASPSSRLGETIQPSSSDALKRFIESVDVITYESENTNTDLVSEISKTKPVYPGVASLANSQHRLTEKNAFRKLGIQTADFERVTSLSELKSAVATLGLPIVLKTTTEGYDGKGQAVIKDTADIDSAWNKLQGKELIAEAFVTFSRELSIIAARSASGEIKVYPLAENDHSEGILRVSKVPVQNLSKEKEEQAAHFISLMLEELNHVGVLTIELFDTESGLVANEMAPRVHNSGHWTQQGAYTCQFENHVRAICDMPLGSTETTQPFAAMINIIGKNGDANAVLSNPTAHLHMYGKEERLNRKIGHINLTSQSLQELDQNIQSFNAFINECGK
jgi:5-(carboxyamino)imidazole ribonucleotide synthase